MWITMQWISRNFWENTDVENLAPSHETTAWNYFQTVLKGVGIVAVGGMAYTFFRILTTRASSEKHNLAIQSRRATTDAVTSENLAVAYRGKRDLIPLFTDLLVNTYTDNLQDMSDIASLSNGDFVITWSSYNQVSNISGYDIYAQRFSNNGTSLGEEFLVNTKTADNQKTPVITGLSNGDFVIVWLGFRKDYYTFDNWQVYAQRFSNNGTRLGEEFLITYSDGESPSISSLNNGGFVVSWNSYRYNSNDGSHIYMKLFDSTGWPLINDVIVNTYMPNNQLEPVVAGLSNGDFVVTWSSYNQVGVNSGYDIYAQRFASNATALGTEFLVNTYNANDQQYPAIIGLINGDFVIAWTSYNQVNSTSDNDIYAQRFSSNGTPLGLEFLVNTYTIDKQDHPTITSLKNGEFMIAWSSIKQVSSLSGSDIYARRFATNGVPLNIEFLVNTYTANDQLNSAITELYNGNVVITWTSYNQVSNTSLYDIYVTSVTLNEVPFLLQNTLTINQGQTLLLSPTNLLANGDALFHELLFLISDINNGYFARINETTLPVFNFTQGEVQARQIQFVQNDSYAAPSYQVSIKNSFNTTLPLAAVIDFYQKPQFIYNQFSVVKNKATQLTKDVLLAVTYRSELEITFEVQNVSRGVFSLNNAIFAFANNVTSFSQSQINNSQIWFVHDGSDVAPSYAIRASCQNVFSNYQLSNISFSLGTTPAKKNTKTIVGAVVGGTGGAILLVGLGIFSGYRYRKEQDNAQERAKYPLANALYRTLPIEGVADFKSAKGVSFVNAVNALEGYLKIDTQLMTKEELDNLGNKLARSIKAQIGYKKGLLGRVHLNISEIEYHAEAIAQTVQTLGAVSLAINIDEMEMKPINQRDNLGKLASYLEQHNFDINALKYVDMSEIADALVEVMDQPSSPVVSYR